MDKQIAFNEYMDEFVKLPTHLKNTEIIDKQRTIIKHLLEYAQSNNINYEFLRSKEINDITDKEGSDNDYLEAMMVYSENIGELIDLILLTR